LKLVLDSELNVQVQSEGAEPVAFVPDLDLAALDAPNIIDGF
jgi:hypothetical protein